MFELKLRHNVVISSLVFLNSYSWAELPQSNLMHLLRELMKNIDTLVSFKVFTRLHSGSSRGLEVFNHHLQVGFFFLRIKFSVPASYTVKDHLWGRGIVFQVNFDCSELLSDFILILEITYFILRVPKCQKVTWKCLKIDPNRIF